MPPLPHDPSIYVDDATILEWVEELSWRLRRNAVLRAWLGASIGNHWQEFEEGLSAFWLSVLLQEGGYDHAIAQLFERVAPFGLEHLREIKNEVLDAALRVMPFYAAASFSELAERILNMLIDVCGADWEELSSARRKERLERAQIILKAGTIYR